MKNLFIALLLGLGISCSALAETNNGRDIIATMNDVTIQSIDPGTNTIQITLRQPTINYKVEFEKIGMTPLTPLKFSKLWERRNENQSSFSQDPPNATLSFWNENGDFFEMDFVIQGVKTTTDGLILNAQFLEKKAPIFFASHEGKKASQLTLAQLEESMHKKSSIVLVIDRSPFDPWRRHHHYG